MRALAIGSLSIRDFRNLSKVDLDLGPRFNVLFGDNGQGKTNLLEAVYVLATSRSFRTARLEELVASDAETASVRGRVVETGEDRDQSVGMRRGLRSTRIDGKRPPSLAAYALRTPIVVFHPGAMALSAGGGVERRRLLDRLALHASPASLAHGVSYGRAMRARQRVLEKRGESAGVAFESNGTMHQAIRLSRANRRPESSAAGRPAPAAGMEARIKPTVNNLRENLGIVAPRSDRTSCLSWIGGNRSCIIGSPAPLSIDCRPQGRSVLQDGMRDGTGWPAANRQRAPELSRGFRGTLTLCRRPPGDRQSCPGLRTGRPSRRAVEVPANFPL